MKTRNDEQLMNEKQDLNQIITDFFAWDTSTHFRSILFQCLDYAMGNDELNEHRKERSSICFLVNQVCSLIDKLDQKKNSSEQGLYEFLDDFFAWNNASGYREDLLNFLHWAINDPNLDDEEDTRSDYSFNIKLVIELIYQLERVYTLKAA